MKIKKSFLPGNYILLGKCKTALIYVYDVDKPKYTFTKAVKIMKTLLAQRIPIVDTASLDVLFTDVTRRFMTYSRGILDIPCQSISRTTKIQVVIIGHG